MSRVHDAMRGLEHKSPPEISSGGASDSLVGALLEELANEVPDDPRLETVRMDLIAASRLSSNQQKDLAMRFYLAFRSLLRENELLQERLRKAEKRNYAQVVGHIAVAPPAATDQPNGEVVEAPAEQAVSAHV